MTDHALRQQYRDAKIAVKSHVTPGRDDLVDVLRSVDPISKKPAELERLLGNRAHRDLPGIEIGELASHRDQNQAGKSAVLQE